MNIIKKTNIVSLLILFIFSFLIRFLPIFGNNFYFTVDQGRDAVFARDILHGNFPLVGPVTDIEGVYHGVFWYYLNALFYFIFGGHPIGSVLFLITLNSFLIITIYFFLKKEIGTLVSFTACLLLSVLISFYETSRYAFNPFLLPSITFLFLYSLVKMKENPKYTLLSAISVGLVFHSEVAVFPLFALMFLSVGLYNLRRKTLQIGNFFLGIFLIFVFLLPLFLYEFTSGFSQINNFLNHAGSFESVFKISLSQRFSVTIGYLIKLVGEVTLPPLPLFGLFIYLLANTFYLVKKRHDRSVIFQFVVYGNLLLVLSVLWFSLNKGIRPWHLAFLSVPIFISFIASLSILPKKIFAGITIILFILQSFYLTERIIDYRSEKEGAGLLKNQLEVLDWIYQKAENSGFTVYTYVPSVYDFHYQYLIYWYGLGKYKYLPCEYSTYPKIDASAYIPHSKIYQEPKKSCTAKRFLIMEPTASEDLRKVWYEGASENTELIDKKTVNKIIIEERKEKKSYNL
jgi:4-amino-4-deoxy-L-arabinose transferase-like glycosyltransferase